MRTRKSAKSSIFTQEKNRDDITSLNLVPTPTIRPSGARRGRYHRMSSAEGGQGQDLQYLPINLLINTPLDYNGGC